MQQGKAQSLGQSSQIGSVYVAYNQAYRVGGSKGIIVGGNLKLEWLGCRVSRCNCSQPSIARSVFLCSTEHRICLYRADVVRVHHERCQGI